MEKLVCDKCGFELTEKEDIYLALDGRDAWHEAQRSRGFIPRGVFPCKYYFQCKGEMLFVKESKKQERPVQTGKTVGEIGNNAREIH